MKCNIIFLSLIALSFNTFIKPAASSNSLSLLGALDTYSKMYGRIIANIQEINLPDENGNTPLHYNVVSAPWDIITNLVACKANVNAANNRGFTPLHLAVATQNNTIVDFLINQKASLSAKNFLGQTPFENNIKLDRKIFFNTKEAIEHLNKWLDVEISLAESEAAKSALIDQIPKDLTILIGQYLYKKD